MSERERRTPAEHLVDRAREDVPGVGKPLSRRAAQTQRSLEDYLKAGNRPRWMERLVEIERGTTREQQRLEKRYLALRAQCGADRAQFARRWREVAESFECPDINLLIDQHNEWYPIERQLPVDIRTRDYVRVAGRSYRRPRLDAAWVLERFPAG